MTGRNVSLFREDLKNVGTRSGLNLNRSSVSGPRLELLSASSWCETGACGCAYE